MPSPARTRFSLVNVSVINLLNLHREGPWDLLVDSDGLMHLRGALNLSDVYVRAGYRYHRWFTTLNGHIRLHFPQLKLELHTTLANLTSLELIGFRVASIIPPQVVEFSGATTLFNWIGARRVQNLMDASTSILVENFENFVRTSVTAVMQSKKYSSQRCQQQSEQNQQRNQPQDHQQQRHQDPSIENWGTTANWTDLSNGTEDTLLTRQ
ncbi:uncharacterized protein LOC111263075 isoform X2 [Varroa jacobsoni]|uniref:Uncharacterized protein n=1 Tax=Varroa destructor TaxID=109461 RepID=A0A7M7JM01_VARDE|nr:uncharacterized protein LOC111247499 isoform X2 [Varroa destructor]XP_022693583.1 uncharacterized protein LOC111263075 isoform X2 [Varroa jacobsoni]